MTDPVLEYIENSRNGMQNGMQNRIAIIREENNFKLRKTKGEKTKKPYNIYIYVYLIVRSPLWDFRCIFLGFYRDPVHPVVFRQGSFWSNFSFFAVFFGAKNFRHIWNFFVFLGFQTFIAFFQTPSLKSKRDRQDRYNLIRFQTFDIKRKTAKNSLKNPRLLC